ncbi:hypothetical protein L198_05679 [Cryptococcus wingfieldii CBS 7118]|uniref:Uncharacterized protein n=1 Tax=Cryptococcus wingfieldii CBS 7118 TaxID=1295528 RepID=A0A1E3ITS0_9TREE|nr:hypothetical protein L198_05679 [Cryptococcus wingfieldii CBS 7118]ODN92007.1 hypothetical protein L198_05679 [Cryptococcus wingfieldii CBS 7118]
MLRQGSMIRVHVIPLNGQDPQIWPSTMFEKQQNLIYPKGITPNHMDNEWVKRTIEKKEERDNKGKPKFWVKLEHKFSHCVLRWKEISWEELATQVTQDAATAHAARLAATCAKSGRISRNSGSEGEILPSDNVTPYIDSPAPSPVTRVELRPSMILSCGKSLDSPLHTGLLPSGRILEPSAPVVMNDKGDGTRRMVMIRKQIDKWKEVLEEFPQTKMDCMRHVDRLEKEMADMRDRCSEIW